jgi:hypothetical protein
VTGLSIAVLFVALLLRCIAYYTLKHRIEPFMYEYYLFSWWSYILFLEAVLSFRSRRFLVLTAKLPYWIVMSCAFWCLFELINLRLANWFYINMPIPVWIRYPGYLLAYGTVIPGIYLTKELLSEAIKRLPVKPITVPRSYPALAISSGFVLLALALAFPVYCFALAWAFLALIMDGWNYAKGHRSFMGEVEKGRAGGLVTTLLAGLICGFLWEFWNWNAISKWVYTVPYFDKTKLFEMPLMGYLGFAVFALATVAFVTFMKEGGLLDRYRIPALIIALAVSAASFLAIDRQTIFSYVTPIEEMSVIEPETRSALQSEGIRTIYGIKDLTVFEKNERDLVMLMELKGLGYENTLKLSRAGIHDMAGLAALTPQELAAILAEKNLRRTGVYIRAAHGTMQDLS